MLLSYVVYSGTLYVMLYHLNRFVNEIGHRAIAF